MKNIFVEVWQYIDIEFQKIKTGSVYFTVIYTH